MCTSFGGITKKFILVPLTNKQTNFKTEGNNFLIIMKAHLKKDCDGCKKLEKKDEFKGKIVSKKVYSLLVEFTGITSSVMSDGLLPLQDTTTSYRPSS